MDSPLRRLVLGLNVLATIVLVGAVGYRLAGWSLLDTLYMVAITLSTVGFRETPKRKAESGNPQAESPARPHHKAVQSRAFRRLRARRGAQLARVSSRRKRSSGTGLRLA